MKGKQLKSLEEHNTTAITLNASLYNDTPQLNGIACPNCDEELMDSNPMITLTSNPPQKNVCCSSCDYVGYRFI